MITDVDLGAPASSPVLEETVIRGDDLFEYALYRKDEDGRDSFSIRAIQYRRGVPICRAVACDVSSLYCKAKEMFDLIVKGCVEPYVLCDVIYDLLP